MEKCVTVIVVGLIRLRRVAKESLTILVIGHTTIANLEHVEIVPVALAGLLPERSREVDDAGHGTNWGTVSRRHRK